MNKFKELFKKKEINPELQRKRIFIEAGFYILLFIFVISFSYSSKNNDDLNVSDTSSKGIQSYTQTSTINLLEEKIELLKECNYNLKVTIEMDDQKEYYEKSSENCEKELVLTDSSKMNFDGYYRNKNTYYVTNKDKIEKANNPGFFDKKNVLKDIKKIIEIMQNENTTISKNEDSIEYLFTNATVLSIYNDANKSQYVSNNTSSSIIINNIENGISIVMDLKEAYNIINNDSKKSVIYTFELKDIGMVSLEEIEKMIVK